VDKNQHKTKIEREKIEDDKNCWGTKIRRGQKLEEDKDQKRTKIRIE